MILSPIDAEDLPGALDVFQANLLDDVLACRAFARIRRSVENARGDERSWHADAVALAASLGIETLDEEPQHAFSWDGYRIRTRSEPSVVIHEIAHWQLCPPERRHLRDFGLGAGPETGRRAEADAVAAAAEHFRRSIARLHAAGFVDADGRPLPKARSAGERV
jgi:hypothetical protein